MVVTETSFPRGGVIPKKSNESTIVSENWQLNFRLSQKYFNNGNLMK